MGRFIAVLCMVFALGLMTSVSMAAKAPAPSPVPMASLVKSPAAATPRTSAPSKVATPPCSASSPSSSPPTSAEGAGTALPPSSGASATTSLERMAILGAAWLGGAAFLV